MKGKLIKTEVNYLLEGEGGVVIASTSLKKEGLELSLKKCRAIELGYDLDELAYSSFPNGTYETSEIDLGLDMYKLGFQKSLELMGDKIFTLDDMYTVFIMGREGMEDKMNRYVTRIHEPIEWDVEIEMGYVGECNGNNDNGCFQDSSGHNCGCFKRKPKLDADGCLILKI